MPTGYWTTWGGQFENLQSASNRLRIVVPLALALVFMLLFAMFGNLKDGLLVFTGIPFALTGGIVALWRKQWDGCPHPTRASMCQSGSVTSHSNRKGHPP